MNGNPYELLKLENQLCFPLYAAARATIRLYKPILDRLDLTYTQYITMMVLWERQCLTAKELGDLLFLDSGTLTPLLKKMEAKGLLTRKRSREDERSLVVTVTDAGMALREEALSVPAAMADCLTLPREDAVTLYNILYKMLGREGMAPKAFL